MFNKKNKNKAPKPTQKGYGRPINPLEKTVKRAASALSTTQNYSRAKINSVRYNVIGFFSPYDGVGKTTLVVNVAYALAARGSSVCVVDLDFLRPDVFRYLAPDVLMNDKKRIATIKNKIINSNYSVTECVNHSIFERVSFVSSSPDEHAISYMSQDGTEEQKVHELDTVLKIYSELSRIYDFVLLDLKSDITETTSVVALKVCDYFFTVTDGSIRSLEYIMKSNKEFAPMKFKNKLNNFILTKSRSDSINEREMKDIIPGSTIIASVPYSESVLSIGDNLGLFMKDCRKSDAITQATKNAMLLVAETIYRSAVLGELVGSGKRAIPIKSAAQQKAEDALKAPLQISVLSEPAEVVIEPVILETANTDPSKYNPEIRHGKPANAEQFRYSSSFEDVTGRDFLTVPNLKIVNGRVLVSGEEE